MSAEENRTRKYEDDPQPLNEAARRYYADRSAENLEEVAKAGTPLVNYFARMYSGGQTGCRVIEDLQQTGYEGLMKAIHRYQPEKGASFVTYASHYILGSIRHYLKKERSVDRPGWIVDLQGKILQATEDYIAGNGSLPGIKDIAAMVNVSEESVVQAMRGGWLSLDEVDVATIKSTGYDNFRLPIEDKIVIEEAMERLTKIQYSVIYNTFYRDLTQTQIARKLDISQRQVSRHLHRGLAALAKFLS